MSVGTRKVLYIDGTEADAEQGSVEFELGGLEGEAEMSETQFAGVSQKAMPGKVTAKILLNGKLKKDWWEPGVTFDLEVEMPETGQVAVFPGMYQIKVFKGAGKSAEIEFVGPAGAYS